MLKLLPACRMRALHHRHGPCCLSSRGGAARSAPMGAGSTPGGDVRSPCTHTAMRMHALRNIYRLYIYMCRMTPMFPWLGVGSPRPPEFYTGKRLAEQTGNLLLLIVQKLRNHIWMTWPPNWPRSPSQPMTQMHLGVHRVRIKGQQPVLDRYITPV